MAAAFHRSSSEMRAMQPVLAVNLPVDEPAERDRFAAVRVVWLALAVVFTVSIAPAIASVSTW